MSIHIEVAPEIAKTMKRIAKANPNACTVDVFEMAKKTVYANAIADYLLFKEQYLDDPEVYGDDGGYVWL